VQGLAQSALVQFGAGRNLVFHQHLAQPMRQLVVQCGWRQTQDFSGHALFCMQKSRAVNA
jgi:hypothetical protein